MKKASISPVGDRLGEARQALSLSQMEMATQLGLSVQSYGRYERGERELPSAALTKLAQMGISVTWLLTGMGDHFSGRELEATGNLIRRLNGIEETLSRLKMPVVVEGLGENSALKDIYRQLIEIAGDVRIADDLRARADMLLALAFADAEAISRREAHQGPDDLRRRMTAASESYSRIVGELAWDPPMMTGMAVRDAMVLDGLSEETARLILASVQHDMAKLEEQT